MKDYDEDGNILKKVEGLLYYRLKKSKTYFFMIQRIK